MISLEYLLQLVHNKHRPKLSKHGTDRFCLSNAHSQCLKSLDYIPKANPGGPFCYLATDSFLRQNTEVQQSKFIVWPVCPIRNFQLTPPQTLLFPRNNQLLQKTIAGVLLLAAAAVATACCLLL